MTVRNPWEPRASRVLRRTIWPTLGLGVFLSFAESQGWPQIWAALAGTVYALMFQWLPGRTSAVMLRRDVTAIVGSALTMTAVGLTGGLQSPYLLFAATPIMFAGLFAGVRITSATAGIASGIVLGLALLEPSVPWIETAYAMGLFAVVGVIAGMARNLLVERDLETARAEASEASAVADLHRLKTANSLLNDLTSITHGGSFSPASIASPALETLNAEFDLVSSAAAISSHDGPVIVATVGDGASAWHRLVPLLAGELEVGLINTGSSRRLGADEVESMQTFLAPLALGFANALMLQDLAVEATSRERARVARELHDTMGPTLASLGLRLDTALATSSRMQLTELADLRSQVSTLGDDLRRRVADLREPDHPSITESLRRVAAGLPTGPRLDLDLVEHRLPRPALRPEISAILIESLRNAWKHAGATHVIVSGRVDFGSGHVTVRDNGHGFDPAGVSVGHYGLIGIQERAEAIGGAVTVKSGKSGTRVSLSWGPL